MPPPLDSILETCLCADDLEAAEAFYRDGLGLEVYTTEPERHVFFRCGRGMFLVFRSQTTTTGRVVINGVPLPQHGTSGAGHVAFRVAESSLSAWKQCLVDANVVIEAEVTWPNGGRSLYIRDPAGNSVELVTATLWGLPE